MGDHLRRMAGIEDGMSDTGDPPDTEMKEGPGPSARDPENLLGEPSPLLGKKELQKRTPGFQFRLCRGNSDGVSWPQAVRSPQPLY